MTDQNLTEIVCILDRSGSMSGVVTDTIGAYNSFITEQKKVPGQARVSLVLFDNDVTHVYVSYPLTEAPVLTTEVYQIRGATALNDAVGSTIQMVGARLAGLPEEMRPGKVIVMVITDGQENSSKEYSADQVKHAVTHQRNKYGWQFIYLGSHKDAFAEAEKIGISRNHAIYFNARNTGLVGQHVNSYVSASRSALYGAQQMDWSNEARASVGDDPNLAPVAGTIDTSKP